MKRRTHLISLGVGITTAVTGCLNFTGSSQTQQEDTAEDAPSFTTREDGSGGFILLRIQPQTPNGPFRGDEFEIGVVLGNTTSKSLTGEVTVKFVPSSENGSTQTASISVVGEDSIPSGAARFFRAGPFQAVTVGDWELVAGTNISQVHPSYNGTVTVQPQPSE